MDIQNAFARLKQIVCLGCVTLMASASLMLGWGDAALAKNVVDQVTGAGTTNQVEGRAKEDIGRVQRQVDGTTGQIEGAAKQAQGRAQRDIGRTQDAAEDAAEAVEDSAENFIDAAKKLFD